MKKIPKKVTEVFLTLKIYSQAHISFFAQVKVRVGYSAHQTTYQNLLKTWLILEIKFDLELAILKVKGVCGNFFTIFFIFSA